MTDLSKMTKAELEAHGRIHGVELDRRDTKAKLVAQLKRIISAVPVEATLVEAIEEVEVEVSVNPEVEAATALLASMAQSSSEAAAKQADKEASEAEQASAEQAAKDAKRMAEQAIESHIQAVNKARILTGQAATAQRVADEATREVEVLASAAKIAKETAANTADYLAQIIAKNS
jgi:hypothetical protein